jgi:hypothetical protein
VTNREKTGIAAGVILWIAVALLVPFLVFFG